MVHFEKNQHLLDVTKYGECILVYCGVFTLANTFHLANGDKVCRINFDQRKMREHVVQCYTKGKFSAFPCSKFSIQRTTSKKVLLQLHCVCKMPACFDDYMIS